MAEPSAGDRSDLDGLAGLLGGLDYPMAVVTTAIGDHRAGCLVGFFTQCSIDPLRVMVFLSVANHTYRLAEDAQVLAVHLLDVAQHDLAALFGEESGDWADKLSPVAWDAGPGGVPVLADAPAWFTGRILSRVPAGDHVGFLLDPLAAERRRSFTPLTFQQVADLDAGHPA